MIASIREFINEYGYELLLGFFGFCLLFLLLWFRLGSMNFGYAAPVETLSREQAASWSAIIANPLNAPYTVMQRLVLATGHSGVTSMRLISTVWAVLAIVLFYIVARQWHNPRVAGLATWLFLSTSWFLHTARLATPEVLWLAGILALVVLFTPAKEGLRNRLNLPLYLIVLSVVLYIPGMIWLVLISVVIQRKKLVQAWQAADKLWVKLASIAISLSLLVPLARAIMINPELARQWSGVSSLPQTALEFFNRLAAIPKHLFVAGPDDPVRWLGSLPLLSVFETLMFIVGIYFYATHFRAARARLIIVLSIAAACIIAVGGMVSLSVLVPAVYLFVATGIAYMLQQWLKVFPNNPIARSVGISVLIFAVLLTSVYQTRSYFVAWRYNMETIEAFDQKL